MINPASAHRPRRGRAVLAAADSSTGAWEWDVATGDVRWSPELQSLTGCDAGSSGYEAAGRFLARVPAEDRSAAAPLFAPRPAGSAAVVVQHRFDCANGERRWVESAVAGSGSGPDGRVTRLRGTVRVLAHGVHAEAG